MERTFDAELVARRFAPHGMMPDAATIRSAMDDWRNYALVNEIGTFLFVRQVPGLFLGSMEMSRGTGAQKKATILATEAWMFVHSEALILTADVIAENAPSRFMLSLTLGAAFEARADGTHCRISVGRWAAAYGVDRAVAAMRAGGQAAKADRLAAAVEASR